MNISIEDIIAKSKERLNNTFFRIVKDGDEFKVVQYVGVQKSSTTMLNEGWNKHIYLADYINSEYPIFDISDFKSEDGFMLIKKNEDDILKDAFKEVIEYCQMNRNLATAFSELKNLLQKINVDFKKFSNFNEMIVYSKNYIDSLSLSQIDKANLLFKLTDCRIAIFEELEKLNIVNPLSFLSEKFKCFMLLV